MFGDDMKTAAQQRDVQVGSAPTRRQCRPRASLWTQCHSVAVAARQAQLAHSMTPQEAFLLP